MKLRGTENLGSGNNAVSPLCDKSECFAIRRACLNNKRGRGGGVVIIFPVLSSPIPEIIPEIHFSFDSFEGIKRSIVRSGGDRLSGGEELTNVV